MKKGYFIFMLGCMMSFISFSQITDYAIYTDSTYGCQTLLTVSMAIGPNAESGGIISVDWGDGTSSTNTYSSASTNTTDYEHFSHSYATSGNYTASFNIYSTTAGANVDAGQSISFYSFGSTNCGYIWIATISQYTPGTAYTSYSNVPYQFTDVNGNITVLTPPSGLNPNVYPGLNPANAPYTGQIDPTWLAANGLAQTSPNFTISSFGASGTAANWSEVVLVSCNSQVAQPDFGVNYAWAPNFVAPTQSGQLILDICNYACMDSSDVSVSITLPANFVPNTSNLTNAVVSGNTLTFDILSLGGCYHFHIPFTFPGNTQAGTPFCFDIALSNPNDTDLSNNTYSVCDVVRNSYDPNEKQVNLPTLINPDAVDHFQYFVHFQNDGNYDAAKVVITDSISPNLDLSTFRLISSKHGVSASVNTSTRIVTFTFDNINLGQSAVDLDASQGYVVYSISELPNLPVGTEIENTAYIYFDFNPAIVTNTTYNINQTTLGLSGNSIEQIGMYPNPAKDKLQFSGASVKEITVYDLTGKVVLTACDLDSNEISLSTVQTGIYQVVLKTETGSSTQKLVIQK
ncbi:T9SS type A sorting domain-containing protein [Fluviicola sp.]|uniref:T9SS type A sorting domain-containing protein n=1 Tax=Fluviicola sp. TaxID=1917219 RepID=UPI0031DC7E7A